jgi:hypothetical protein
LGIFDHVISKEHGTQKLMYFCILFSFVLLEYLKKKANKDALLCQKLVGHTGRVFFGGSHWMKFLYICLYGSYLWATSVLGDVRDTDQQQQVDKSPR